MSSNTKLMDAILNKHFASIDEKVRSRLLAKAWKFNDIVPIRKRKYGPYKKLKYMMVKLV